MNRKIFLLFLKFGFSLPIAKPDEVLASVASRSKYFEMWRNKQWLIPRKRESISKLPKVDSDKRWDGVKDKIKTHKETFIPIKIGYSSKTFDMFGKANG